MGSGRTRPSTAARKVRKMKTITSNRAGEEQQRWTAALRSQMGMPEAGSGTDAVRWFAIGVPDQDLIVRLSTAAVEGRVDLVASVFLSDNDAEPTGFAVCYRKRDGVDFVACAPVELEPGEPLGLYNPGHDTFYQLDDRCALARRTGALAGKSLRVAHQRAMKRLGRAARAITPQHTNLKWQDLRGAVDISIPHGKVSKVTVLAA